MESILHGSASPSKKTGTLPAAISFEIDGKSHKLLPNQVDDEEIISELENACNSAKGPIRVFIERLPWWPGGERISAIDFLTSLTCSREYQPCNKESYTDLFLALLDLVADTSDLKRHEATKVTALEAAAVSYSNALEAACTQLTERLRKLGVKGVRTENLVKQARQIREEIDRLSTPDREDETVSVHDEFSDAPVGDNIIVPPGWELTDSGTFTVSEDGTFLVIRSPVLVTERHVDINRETESLTLAWRRDGQWKTRVFDRGSIASSRAIVDALAPYGVPVTSNNAKDLIQYLDDFEAENVEVLPVTRVSHQLGWQGRNGEEGFLLGTTLIKPGTQVETNGACAGDVTFKGADEGDEQIAAGFHQQGTFEGWIKAIKQIQPYHRVRLALYAAFVPVLLRIFQSPNFIVDFSGRTTTGKTTTMRVAASAWGNPDEQQTTSVVKTWDGTATWRERLPAVQNHLPVILDDTRHVRSPEEVAKTIYSVAQGVGRGRGSVKGLARQDTWRTVLLTTGEQPATSFTEDGGTRARVFSLWGSPFGASSSQMGQCVRAINEAIKQNYGHAGPRFVRFLLDNRGDWEGWCQEYRDELKKFEDWTEGNPFAARMAPHFAAICTAAWLAHQALDLPWEYEDPIEPLWDELVQEAGEADRAAAALRHVLDWAYSHQGEFFGRSRMDYEPHGGWAGRWNSEEGEDDEFGHGESGKKWPWIGFIPSRLKSILREGGFEYESIVRAWHDKGWLMTSNESNGINRRQYRARVGNEKKTCLLVAIKRSAVDEICPD